MKMFAFTLLALVVGVVKGDDIYTFDSEWKSDWRHISQPQGRGRLFMFTTQYIPSVNSQFHVAVNHLANNIQIRSTSPTRNARALKLNWLNNKDWHRSDYIDHDHDHNNRIRKCSHFERITQYNLAKICVTKFFYFANRSHRSHRSHRKNKHNPINNFRFSLSVITRNQPRLRNASPIFYSRMLEYGSRMAVAGAVAGEADSSEAPETKAVAKNVMDMIFIRHVESQFNSWSDDPSRLSKTRKFFKEGALFTRDAVVSHRGQEQLQYLHEYFGTALLKYDREVNQNKYSMLAQEDSNSIGIESSTLGRAMLTAFSAMDSFIKALQPIKIEPRFEISKFLQEVSKGPDAYSKFKAGYAADFKLMSQYLQRAYGSDGWSSICPDVETLIKNDKLIFNSPPLSEAKPVDPTKYQGYALKNGLALYQTFLANLLRAGNIKLLITGGHSHWFRKFLESVRFDGTAGIATASAILVYRKKKIPNAQPVKLTLTFDSDLNELVVHDFQLIDMGMGATVPDGGAGATVPDAAAGPT